MPTLLQLSNDMQALDDLLIANEGDLGAPDVEIALATWARDLEANMENKVDGYAALVTELDRRSDVRHDEAMRMKKLADADEKKADFLRQRLKLVFEIHGIKKLETERFRVSVVNNGGSVPVEVFDESEIPGEYICVPPPPMPQPDKKLILAALTAGKTVPGARLGERGTHLSIK
jgi:tRNA U55 pseudouridine synthase TruB